MYQLLSPKELAKAGVEFHTLTDDQLALWKEAGVINAASGISTKQISQGPCMRSPSLKRVPAQWVVTAYTMHE